MFGTFKELQLLNGGGGGTQHKEFHSCKLAMAPKPRGAFDWAPEEVLPYNGIQLLVLLCD